MSGAVLNSCFLKRLLTSDKEDIKPMLKEDILSTACELSVNFVHICYIRCDLFDCYILNYEIMPATLANAPLFILQDSALAYLRYGGRF